MPDPQDQCKRASQPYVSNRRLWPRRACDGGKVILWTSSTQSQAAELHDESLTGLGVLVDDATMLSVGQDVRLVFPDRHVFATVRHIQPPKNGKQQVGLEWGRSADRFSKGS